MPDQTKPAHNPAETAMQLVDESNRLSATEGAGLTQGLCLIAAGLFSVAAAIRDTKAQVLHKRKNRRRQTEAKPGWKNVPPRAKP